jgi:signal transduction histidine kinase
MVSTTHPIATSVGAQQPRAGVASWNWRTPLPADHDLRPEWYVQLVARWAVVVAGGIAMVMLAVDARGAILGAGVVFGMKLQTVIALAVLGLATLGSTSAQLTVRRVSLALLAIVMLYSVTILIEHLGLDLGLARIPANTALLFLCFSGGVVLGRNRWLQIRWFADGLVIAALIVAMFGVIAFLFGSSSQYPIAHRDPMSIVTALIGFVLATAVILNRTDRGLGKLFNSNASGGVLARRLVPALLFLPIGIGRLTYAGVEAGLYDAAFATAVSVTIEVAILTVVIVATSRMVDRLDTVRRGNEAQIRQMVSDIGRQSKELQRTNKELESFSYSVSHDLRAPIRHIAGFSELLVKTGADSLDPRARHYAAMIVESAEHAGKLIDDLLEFSRMGRAALKITDIDLEAAIHESWSKLVPEQAGRDIELRLATLLPVRADAAMLDVALTNLLSNAVKYTKGRAKAVIDVTATVDGDDVTIEVRDNGVGFDMKYVDKLFGVFQRLHGEEFEGVGIGLANVKRIIERHGGRVWATGDVDRGASFFVTLPRAKDLSA